jgi:hypothetical protein
MIYLLFYSITLFIIIVGFISLFVFVRNTLRELKGEEILTTDFLQSLISATNAFFDQQKTETSIGLKEPQPQEDHESYQKSDLSKVEKRVWVKEKGSVMKSKEAEEAEQFTVTYFMQYGASKINFPGECIACGNKTTPQILKWKTFHEIPALRGAKTPARTDTSNLWTVVGKCLVCDEKYILATESTDGVVGNLEWVSLQRDNYDRMLSFNRKKISKEKLGFILRTLPDRSLIASGLTGKWIWLKSEYRSYV